MPNWTKQQLDAINMDGSNILVSAGAGSGKTAVLSERVLRKIKDGVSVDNLLVLTFTNAAAKEMKERIRNKIKENGFFDELEKIDSAYITTFDSFALSVVKKYHYLVDVGADVNITDASVIYLKKQQILDNLIDELFVQQDSQFEDLICTFCLKDSKDIKAFILNAQSKIDLMYDGELYLENYEDNYFSLKNLDKLYSEFLTILKGKIYNIKNILREISFLDCPKYHSNLLNVFTPLLNASCYSEIKNNLHFDFPRIPLNSGDEIKSFKEKLKKELTELQKLCRYSNEDDIKNSILSTKPYVLKIVDIIKEFNKRFDLLKREENINDFIDIAKMAIKIVKDYEVPRNYYRTKFNEIMIDEYQDTSDLQDLFIKQIEANNVYMVGDIKQSIYRFRNANPNLFKKKYENYSSNIDGRKIDLNKNFRSRSEVVDNINIMFDYIMDLDLGGADYRNTSRLIFGNQMYNEEGKVNENCNLEILNYTIEDDMMYSKSEIEIFTIAFDIKKKIDDGYQVLDKKQNIVRPCNYNDFAIILDRATDFSLYKKIFGYLNLPIIVLKEESVSSAVDIKIIKNIIRLLLKMTEKKYDKEFWYAYFSVARSYLFNQSDEEIFEVYKSKNPFNTDLYKILETVCEDIYNEPIYDILSSIIEKFKFYEKLILVDNIESHIAVLDYMLDLTLNLQNYYTILDYYSYLDNVTCGNVDIKYNLQGSSASGIRIMTIHKSKGLEYPICYFAGLYKTFNISELNSKFIYDNKYGFIVPCKKDGLKVTIMKDLLKNNYIYEEISEKIRLFYVALTRAKEKMIFVCSMENKTTLVSALVSDKNSRLECRSFLDFMNLIYSRLKKYIKKVKLDEIGLTKDYNYSLKRSENKMEEGNYIKTEDFSMSDEVIKESKFSKNYAKISDESDRNKLETGLLIHSIMENLDLLNPNFDDIEKDYIPYVQAFLSSGVLDNVINYYQEYEFIYEQDDTVYHGVIDLLLEYKDRFLIVDYKLKNTFDQAYKDQLLGYKKYIESISLKKVDVILYSFLDKKFSEVLNVKES